MAENINTLCLLGAMDHFWFYSHVLSATEQPVSILLHPLPLPPLKTVLTTAVVDREGDDREVDNQIRRQKDECNNEAHDEEKSTMLSTQRPTRLNTMRNLKTRSQSVSPSAEKRTKKLYYSSSMGALPESTSMVNFKTLWDLEQEEVKGFIDLGFTFKKEQINKRLMNLLPGLQRLATIKSMQNINQELADSKDEDTEEYNEDDYDHENDDDDDQQEEKNRGIMRPYLSEAWLIKRPDSPLLNLKVPRGVSAAADMKKHLKSWARTVASEIQQES